jgi:hypothetical protein
MRTNTHAFCRQLLLEARAEAQRMRVAVPVGLTAMESTRDLYFVEARATSVHEYVKGCCVWSAKAHYIMQLVDAKAGAA